jgi:hypothetical protein
MGTRQKASGHTGPPPHVIVSHLAELEKKADAMPQELPCDDDRARYKDILRQTKLDYRLKLKAPPACIKIEVNGKSATFGTLGNFSVLRGRAKSKKTFFASMILAAALRNGIVQNTIRCSFPEDKRKIVVFDTEQADFDVQIVIERALILAGMSAEDAWDILDVYHLRELSPKDRVGAIGEYITYSTGLGLVILDGARDTTYNINDSEQASEAVTNLLRWTSNKGIHLLTVIHVNKGDANATGFLGGELTKKGETSAEIAKDSFDPSVSIVKPGECRRQEFGEFAFAVDDSGIPHIVDGYKTENESKSNRSKLPTDISNEIHREALKKAFANEPQIGGTGFVSAIIVAFESLGIKFGENAARKFVAYYRQNKMISVLDRQAGNRTFYSLPYEPPKGS